MSAPRKWPAIGGPVDGHYFGDKEPPQGYVLYNRVKANNANPTRIWVYAGILG